MSIAGMDINRAIDLAMVLWFWLLIVVALYFAVRAVMKGKIK